LEKLFTARHLKQINMQASRNTKEHINGYTTVYTYTVVEVRGRGG